MRMDEKERIILEHYKEIISSRKFDEYDILGFLIFIRRHIDKKDEYVFIQEFCDLIAHRERDKGCIYEAIKAGLENGYATKDDRRTIIGYHGIAQDKWIKQCKAVMEFAGITATKEHIKEFTLCVLSLAQGTMYREKDGDYIGKVMLFQGKDNSIGLMTVGMSPLEPYICFFKMNGFRHVKQLSSGIFKEPIETVRMDGKLRVCYRGEVVL